MDKDEALRRIHEARVLAEESQDRAGELVRDYHRAVKELAPYTKMSPIELGRELGKHRNTIRTWCK
jgi:hypothetical protein